jgi:hypothetical protein
MQIIPEFSPQCSSRSGEGGSTLFGGHILTNNSNLTKEAGQLYLEILM